MVLWSVIWYIVAYVNNTSQLSLIKNQRNDLEYYLDIQFIVITDVNYGFISMITAC